MRLRTDTAPTDTVPVHDEALTQQSVSTNEADMTEAEGSQHSLMKAVMTRPGAVNISSMIQ